MSQVNPYNWHAHKPSLPVERKHLIDRASSLLLQGESCILLGGHGTGKSVFLRQLVDNIRKVPDTKALFFSKPPSTPTIAACFEALALELGIPKNKEHDAQAILESYLEANSDTQSIILIYDQVDRYTGRPTDLRTENIGRTLFNNLETAKRELSPKIGIIAAGGLGLFFLRDSLGSDFFGRSAFLEVPPLSEDEIRILAKPLIETRGASPNIVPAVRILSGGNPALTVYALQQLWTLQTPTEADVAGVFVDFRERHAEFIRTFQRNLTDASVSDSPTRVLEEIKKSAPLTSRSSLLQASASQTTSTNLDLLDILRLLKAGGLINIQGSLQADPLQARPIASILNLPSPAPQGEGLRQQLLADTTRILKRIHTMSPDFFRSGTASSDKQIVQEAVFSAVLSVGLREAGWVTEREALHGAGRTDIKLRHERFDGLGVIEVKIWPRNDYKEIHDQVSSYWSTEVRAGIAVMISDLSVANWADDYASNCLKGRTNSYQQTSIDPPIDAHFVAISEPQANIQHEVDHILLRLARR